jgi:hypothetical protein
LKEVKRNEKKLKGDVEMAKYARVVFGEEIPDSATAKEALAIVMKSIKSAPTFLKEEDVEISDYPYERME